LDVISAEIPANANGVLYKLGANSGGLTCFVENGIPCYEYNLFIIQRTKICAQQKLPTGKVKIEVAGDSETTLRGSGNFLRGLSLLPVARVPTVLVGLPRC
jgi:hypothetical protein